MSIQYQKILSENYGFSSEENTTTSGEAQTGGNSNPRNEQGGNTMNGLPTPPIPKLGENLLQINVYLDTLSEQIIATTATYAGVTALYLHLINY